MDALDECDFSELTELLNAVHGVQVSTNLRIMVTSRFEAAIVERFRASPTLEIRAAEQDVRDYVVAQLPRLPRCVQKRNDLAQLIQDTITTAVKGM